MKIGSLTFDACPNCDNYSATHGWCDLEALNLIADDDDVICTDFKKLDEIDEVIE